MPDLKAELTDALKEAMKAKDSARRDAIRLLQSAIKQAEIDGVAPLDNAAITEILSKEAKKRRETIDELERAGRAADAAGERLELAVTEEFLPRQMSPDELRPLVQAAIDESGAASMKEMGQVMRIVIPKVQGRADGAAVSALARELLS